jgi:Holliday junction resolvase-like predicted endonuclease
MFLRMRERMINRRQQGDLGEASAIEWLTRIGATVSIPVGHSPEYDLIAEFEGQLLRVQIKTSVYQTRTRDGQVRYQVGIVTNGGNQSWSGVAKLFDPSRADLLFVLTGDGRRWLIPSDAVEAFRSITVGGSKYSEYEVAPGEPIEPIVYGPVSPALESGPGPGECPSGQRERAVNASAQPTQVRILPPPSTSDSPPKYERGIARLGQTVIWAKRRITIPLRPFEDAKLAIGDRLCVRPEGPGRVVLQLIESSH